MMRNKQSKKEEKKAGSETLVLSLLLVMFFPTWDGPLIRRFGSIPKLPIYTSSEEASRDISPRIPVSPYPRLSKQDNVFAKREYSRRFGEHPVLANSLPQQGKFLLKLAQADNPPIQNPKSKIQNWLEKSKAFLDFISSLASIALIYSLWKWLQGREEQRENELFGTWGVVNDAKGDQSGVLKTAVERLHKKKYSLESLKLKESNLQKAKLEKANLQGANLEGANLANTEKNRTNSQIKSACFWEKAIYEGNWDNKQKKWIVDEEANQEYIKKLKLDKSSDPEEKPDCSSWGQK